MTKNFHGLSIDTKFMKKNNIFLTIKGKIAMELNLYKKPSLKEQVMLCPQKTTKNIKR